MNIKEAEKVWAELSHQRDITDEQAARLVEAIKVLNSEHPHLK